MYSPRTELPPREAFSDAVNTRFDVCLQGRTPVEFTLLECNSLIADARQECYSLIFRGPVDQPPVQDLYQLENEHLGKFQLLLVPIKRDERGIYFEAVMNHLLPS